MTHAEFKAKYPHGVSVGKPFAPYDYVGECVSFVLRYMKEVHNVPVNAPLGHAAQIPYNSFFNQHYQKVAASDRQVGDLMFWGNDAGSWTGVAGHTAIYDGDNKMYNQNWNGDGKVSTRTVFSPGFIGYYRPKNSNNGGDMSAQAITPNELNDVTGALWGVSPADPNHHKNWDGKPFYEAYMATYKDLRTLEYAKKVYMKTQLIETFIKLTENLSFSKTAKYFNTSQPVISRQIKELEEILGVELFRRTKRSVKITEEGRGFLQKIERPFFDLKEAFSFLKKDMSVVEEIHENLDNLRLATIYVYVCISNQRECDAGVSKPFIAQLHDRSPQLVPWDRR